MVRRDESADVLGPGLMILISWLACDKYKNKVYLGYRRSQVLIAATLKMSVVIGRVIVLHPPTGQ